MGCLRTCTPQVTEFIQQEKHYIEVQKDLELVTKERDKGEAPLFSLDARLWGGVQTAVVDSFAGHKARADISKEQMLGSA